MNPGQPYLIARNIAAAAITIYASIAMVGDLVHLKPLKGIGIASAIAPCPKVFCDNQGMEAFASDFIITAQCATGVTTNIVLTPEIYSGLRGPYNRRNVYGAALAFGPKLPRELWQSVFSYGFGSNGTLRAELGLPADATNCCVTIVTRTAGRQDRWILTMNDELPLDNSPSP